MAATKKIDEPTSIPAKFLEPIDVGPAGSRSSVDEAAEKLAAEIDADPNLSDVEKAELKRTFSAA